MTNVLAHENTLNKGDDLILLSNFDQGNEGCLFDIWAIFRWYLGNIRAIFGQHSGDIWVIFGSYLAIFWVIFGRFFG